MGFCGFFATLFCTSVVRIDTNYTPRTKDFFSGHTTISRKSSTSTPQSNKRTQKFSEKASGRSRVLQEFITSEMTYVNLLQEFDHVYIHTAYEPLASNFGNKASTESSLGTILTAEERKTMFRGLQEILKLHSQHILPQLVDATKSVLQQNDGPEDDRSIEAAMNICKVICEFSEWFKLYSSYSVTCDNATIKLTQWISGAGITKQDKARVQAYLAKCKANRRHSQLDMTGYLLLPVQRLTRYKMLLEQLERFTPPAPAGSRDYVTEALARISIVLVYVNDFKRSLDSRSRLCHWADHISVVGPSSLVQPHRVLIREGPVNFIARGAMIKAPLGIRKPDKHMSRDIATVDKMCMAVLCHDLLVLADGATGRYKGRLGLIDVVRLSAMGEARVEWGNVVVFEAYDVSYYLQVDNQIVAEGWVQAINHCRRK
ncbi:hypothetical protein LQV05_005027 [Cryptococcus neoformans]|nr:hypothetical protein J007_03226 [Cryptococcus neoformans var. grubii]OXC61231.1 hypothetical protein C358_03316 [Cryptococcus neoformans var. grubii MW-RSA852]UOH82329.1 hypothetical protein LQV05_005027 [Cryptococcus neoformans]